MANFNKVILVGRLSADPEYKTFANGGAVCKVRFAVTNRKKNNQTNQWEDEPMYIDIDVFNRGEFGKTADLVRDRCHKGTQLLVEGRLHLETWEDKNGGGKRSKHKLVAESVQLLDPRTDGGGGMGGGASYGGEDEAPAPRPPASGGYGGGNFGGGNRGGGNGRPSAPPPRNNYSAPPDDDGPGGGADDIPF